MNRRHFLMLMGAGLAAFAGGRGLEEALRKARLASAPAPAGAPPAARPAAEAAAPAAAPSMAPEGAPMPPLVLYDPRCLLYEGPPVGAAREHPVRVSRLVAHLEAAGVPLERTSFEPAPREALERVHTRPYVEAIARAAHLPQTEFVPGSKAPHPQPHIFSRMRPYAAAALSAGGALAATEAVMKGRARRAFAVVRPSGHHATPQRAMGFCVFNNAAVAARHAQAALGAERVLIVDWDVHHGNGTQAIFEDDPSVLFFSVHQEGLYPKRTGKAQDLGRGVGRGATLNVPLPGGATDADYMAVFEQLLVPAADAFRPDLVIVSAGQDALAADPVSQMRLTPDGFARMAACVVAIAERHAAGRAVFLLEGGYAPDPCAEAALRIVRAIGPDAPAVAARANERVRWAVKRRIALVSKIHGAFAPLAKLGERA